MSYWHIAQMNKDEDAVGDMVETIYDIDGADNESVSYPPANIPVPSIIMFS